VENVQSSLASCGEKQTRLRLKNIGVNTRPNWKRLEHFPAVGIHDGQKLIAAPNEEPVMLHVHIHSRGFFRWRDGPPGLDGIGPRVESYDFVFVLDVVVNHAIAVSHGVFGAAAHGDRRNNRVCGRVDDGSIVGLSIHRDDVF